MTPSLLFAAFGGLSLLLSVVLGYRLQRAEVRAALPPPSVEEARRQGWNEAMDHAAEWAEMTEGGRIATTLRSMKR